jgi:hypothetical protein
MPTNNQAQKCLRVCQAITSCFQPIHLFRYDPDREMVYILAGVNEGVEVIVYSNGLWEFING